MNTGATAIIHKEEAENVPAMAAAGAITAVGQIMNTVTAVAAVELATVAVGKNMNVMMFVNKIAIKSVVRY
jgi:hypothetical protein